ncbi:YtxH domain-containing protein [Loigolactobacillus binensis]|uniref:YtxH domain-containing protein n=1 Tax=Loigolactobacillus binensis TaxID=2559922 RepID=A0ABW3E9Y1_9LACO|nr:YtxH domain-containing protein [Loigolactobacillus binensis]
MKHFSSGLLLGAVAGGLYALFTAKRSGRETQAQIKHYIDGVTEGALAVNDSITKLRQAATVLAKEGSGNATATVQELQQLFTDFNFQTAAPLKRAKDASEKLQHDLGPIMPQDTKD